MFKTGLLKKDQLKVALQKIVSVLVTEITLAKNKDSG